VEGSVIRATYSVCPICLARVPAERLRADGQVFLRKTCPAHGTFQSIVWRGLVDLDSWMGAVEGEVQAEPPCPDACGLCAAHLQGTCCVLLEVTSRCNLACRFCLADGGRDNEPSLEQLTRWMCQLAEPGKTLLQLSGGEPTVRDDLPSVVAAARQAGCRFVQLNTNGIRLAEDPDYVRLLAGEGLSFVFMQFDGTDDRIYERLRGRPLYETKLAAIANCNAHNIGVTLVPTLVPGVNTDSVGDILRFAVSQAPAVRGVHFQPVSYLGRTPVLPTDGSRLTLDELLHAIETQTGGAIMADHLLPSRCDHPLCGFHGDFVVGIEGTLVPLSRRTPIEDTCGCGSSTPEQSRMFVARRWQRPSPLSPATASCCADLHDMGSFVARVQSHGFTVTAMAFQDAGTLDTERLRRCSLHVFDDGRLVPFCSYYLSKWT
jgi:7,8-dihydro-6-hydroxymethylpterin dimethyltransferase